MLEIKSLGLALEGGSVRCSQCGENHHYTVLKGNMTLKRVTAPIGYTGPVKRAFDPVGQE